MPSPRVDHLYSLRLGGDAGRRGVRRYHLLYSGIRRVARSMDLEEVLGIFESDLRHYVAAWAPRRVFVHAGVVRWHGRTIVLPGRSRAGKSRLVEALVRAGATYYSDEFAVLDRRGHVHAFPKPLSLRRDDGSGPMVVPVEDLGGRRGSLAAPPALIAFLEYRPSGRWRPRRLSGGAAILELLGHTVPARLRPEICLEALANAVADASVLRSARGEADEVLSAIEKAARG